MDFGLIPLSPEVLLECNKTTARYGLMLTPVQAAELAETRTQALEATGRIELGGEIVSQIIRRFCDSPYLLSSSYAETIGELVEIFYCYKNETLDRIGDEELIKLMKERFDGVCGGSLELLAERELALVASDIRFGGDLNARELPPEEEPIDEWN